jgi:hypothetical protein
MVGLILASLLAVAVAVVLLRGPRRQPLDDEPWRASLREPEDDEPLDMEEIRRAEEEWGADGESWDGNDDEPWRG